MFTTYQPGQALASVADALSWPQVRLPVVPLHDADGDGYVAHVQR